MREKKDDVRAEAFKRWGGVVAGYYARERRLACLIWGANCGNEVGGTNVRYIHVGECICCAAMQLGDRLR